LRNDYTRGFILIVPGKYLDKYGRCEKMFQTKVVGKQERGNIDIYLPYENLCQD